MDCSRNNTLPAWLTELSLPRRPQCSAHVAKLPEDHASVVVSEKPVEKEVNTADLNVSKLDAHRHSARARLSHHLLLVDTPTVWFQIELLSDHYPLVRPFRTLACAPHIFGPSRSRL